MNLLLLLDMAAAGRGDEVAVQAGDERLTTGELLACAWSGAAVIGAEAGSGASAGASVVGAEAGSGVSALAYVGTNGLAFPIGLFAAAAAGVPFVPLNYRLSHDQLHDLLAPLGDVVVVAEGEAAGALAARGHRVLEAEKFVAAARAASPEVGDVPDDSDGPAVLLYTSGTTAAPKAAVLRHRHLTAYVIGTVEFGASAPDDAALVSVPPYHVAGLANLLSNLYLGRRIVYLHQFDATGWVEAVRREGITHAMVVPTMLARICDVLEAGGGELGSLQSISYGGARTPATVLQRVMELLPEVRLTNAYGLTETSSTIAVLGPEDHRAARDGDPVATTRLSSVGRVLPTIEVQVRGPDGVPLPPGDPGEIWVRGEQVSGEYAGRDTPLEGDTRGDSLGSGTAETAQGGRVGSGGTRGGSLGSGAAETAQGGRVGSGGGWFPTRDRGWVDGDGYLFIEGRSDDTIIRGGENIAPAEIEEVLLRHPDIEQCAVVGIPDEEWGQRIAVAVVLRPGTALDTSEVQAFARRSLRSSKTPDVVSFVESLPYTETGKLLRRQVRSTLIASA